ncbi:hypothetical protein V8F33_008694 [Rhypophila sp. PSN 637]
MADTSIQEGGHAKASEPPLPSTLHSLPTEILTMIFRFAIVYDAWDRGPLRKRTTESLHESATFSRLCKKFNEVIRCVILYQLIRFPRELGRSPHPRDDEQELDGSPPRSDDGQEEDAFPPSGVNERRLKRMEKLLDLFSERSDHPDLVHGIRFSLPGRASVILAAKYIGIMVRILACTKSTLIRARIALPACSERGPIPVDPSRLTPELANLTHLVVESYPSWSSPVYSPAYVPQGLLNQVVSWAPKVHTLILRQLDDSDLANLTLPKTLLKLTILELEEGESSDDPFPAYNDPSDDRLGAERETIFQTLRVGNIEEDPRLEMQPWGNSGHPGQDILDAIIGSSGTSKTLERIHLGDARQIKTLRHIEAPAADDAQKKLFTLSPTVDPEYWLPSLKFLSIHCSNVLMVCCGESRKILEDVIFIHCPKLESLEVTGLEADPEMIHRVLSPLERAIIRTGRSLSRPNPRNVQQSLPGLLKLAKVTLVTANATETMWLFTTVTCRVYLAGAQNSSRRLLNALSTNKFRRQSSLLVDISQQYSFLVGGYYVTQDQVSIDHCNHTALHVTCRVKIPGWPGLHLLAAINTYSLSAATLERLHLGHVRGIDRGDDDSDMLTAIEFRRSPTFMNHRGAGIPRLKLLCIHCTNIFSRYRDENSGDKVIGNIFDGLLNICPQLTYLELTGLLPKTHWIQKVLLPLDKEIRGHTVDQNAPPKSLATGHSLTKVTLVTEGGSEKDWLDTKLTCEYYVARFALMGVEIALYAG